MLALPLRIPAGADLRAALAAVPALHDVGAAFVLQGISVADAEGRVSGGHMGAGCVVRTTAEVLVALLPQHRFSREHDPATGYHELFVRPR